MSGFVDHHNFHSDPPFAGSWKTAMGYIQNIYYANNKSTDKANIHPTDKSTNFHVGLVM